MKQNLASLIYIYKTYHTLYLNKKLCAIHIFKWISQLLFLYKIN